MKEYYCYKIHTLLMKSSVYPPPFYKPPILYGLPTFLEENLDPPSP